MNGIDRKLEYEKKEQKQNNGIYYIKLDKELRISAHTFKNVKYLMLVNMK